jgi:aminoglycoside 3-N-acetyltransferase I
MSRSSRFVCKQLTRADVAHLKSMLRVFGEAFGDDATYQHAVPRHQYLEMLLSKQHFIAVAAMVDGEVVGGLAAYDLPSLLHDPPGDAIIGFERPAGRFDGKH